MRARSATEEQDTSICSGEGIRKWHRLMRCHVYRGIISVCMPYLRITCPKLPRERKKAIAERLTDAVNDLFFNPHAPTTREQLGQRTTVHFTPYSEGDFYIGGRTPAERSAADVTIELSDWGLSVRQQRKVAYHLTPIIAETFCIPPSALENVNIRFHPYLPKDFAVGGRLLSDMIPALGRVAKRLFG